MKNHLSFWLILLSLNVIFAQRNKNTDRAYFMISHDNGLYQLRQNSALNYNNGINLQYQPLNDNRKIGIRSIFPRLMSQQLSYTQPRYGLTMRLYTPLNPLDSTTHVGDRPYAGLTMLHVSGVSNDLRRGERLTTTYSVGLMGARSYQTAFFKGIQRIKDTTARGLRNEIGNDLALNLQASYERMLWNPAAPLEFVIQAEGNCGTVSNYTAFGGMVRLGFLNDYFAYVSGLSPKTNKNGGKTPVRRVIADNLNRRIQFYFFGKANGRLLFDNSLLSGGYLSQKNTPYHLDKSEINHFYAQFEYGYCMSTRFFALRFSQIYRTREFKSGKNTTWGNVSLSVGF